MTAGRSPVELLDALDALRAKATPGVWRVDAEALGAAVQAVLELAGELDHEATCTLASAPKIAAKEDAADRIRTAVAAALTEGGPQ